MFCVFSCCVRVQPFTPPLHYRHRHRYRYRYRSPGGITTGRRYPRARLPPPPPTRTPDERSDAAQEVLESLASEGVEPDARCYRLAAEAFRRSGDEESEASTEVERLLGIAERLESGEGGEVSTRGFGGGDGGEGGGGGGGGDGCDGGGGGGVDLGEVLDSLGVSGTAELRALLKGAGEVEFDP